MAIEYPSYEAATGKPVYSTDNGKPAKDCGGAVDHCTDCNSNQDATATGGATPFDWGNVCTWMDNSTWGGTAFSDVGTSCTWTIVQDTPSPQGAVAYVKRKKFELQQAVNLILDAGGCPILAHPYTLNLPHPKLESLLIEMKGMGLKGIEVYHSDHSNQQITEYLELATKLNLDVSGGTDFHGKNKPDVQLGTGHGNLKIPYSVLEKLRKAY